MCVCLLNIFEFICLTKILVYFSFFFWFFSFSLQKIRWRNLIKYSFDFFICTIDDDECRKIMVIWRWSCLIILMVGCVWFFQLDFSFVFFANFSLESFYLVTFRTWNVFEYSSEWIVFDVVLMIYILTHFVLLRSNWATILDFYQRFPWFLNLFHRFNHLVKKN